jgi:hypothetical protein
LRLRLHVAHGEFPGAVAADAAHEHEAAGNRRLRERQRAFEHLVGRNRAFGHNV